MTARRADSAARAAATARTAAGRGGRSTLGNFFDEWGQPLGPDQVGPAHGKVTVIVNGRVFTGNPRNAPLGSLENLQLEVGTPLVAPETIDWSSSGL